MLAVLGQFAYIFNRLFLHICKGRNIIHKSDYVHISYYIYFHSYVCFLFCRPWWKNYSVFSPFNNQFDILGTTIHVEISSALSSDLKYNNDKKRKLLKNKRWYDNSVGKVKQRKHKYIHIICVLFILDISLSLNMFF